MGQLGGHTFYIDLYSEKNEKIFLPKSLDDFLKTVEAKVIIINKYSQPNETMTINKFQRSRLTFDPSAKVAYQYIKT